MRMYIRKKKRWRWKLNELTCPWSVLSPRSSTLQFPSISSELSGTWMHPSISSKGKGKQSTNDTASTNYHVVLWFLLVVRKQSVVKHEVASVEE
jgi:hypothetical protein